MKKIVAAAVVAASLISAAPASALTFAAFTQQDQGDRFAFTNNNVNGAGQQATITSTGTGIFEFDFWPAWLNPTLASQDANFSMTGIATLDATLSGPVLEQMVDSGTISFTRVTPFNGMTNLLTINFTDAFLWGPLNSFGVNYIGSSSTGTVTFTSDFLDLSGTTQRDFSLALSGLSGRLQIASNGMLKSFTGDTTGVASAIGPIPEPATWAMMIIGFVGVGSALRRHRTAFV